MQVGRPLPSGGPLARCPITNGSSASAFSPREYRLTSLPRASRVRLSPVSPSWVHGRLHVGLQRASDNPLLLPLPASPPPVSPLLPPLLLPPLRPPPVHLPPLPSYDAHRRRHHGAQVRRTCAPSNGLCTPRHCPSPYTCTTVTLPPPQTGARTQRTSPPGGAAAAGRRRGRRGRGRPARGAPPRDKRWRWSGDGEQRGEEGRGRMA